MGNKNKTFLSRLLQIIMVIIFMALLLAPLCFIYVITYSEMQQYNPTVVPIVQEKAYGEALAVLRMDMKEAVVVSGSFVSNNRFFVNLPTMKNPYEARMLISYGEIISEGQLIGYQADGTTEIRAAASGVVREIHMAQSCYIQMDSIEDIALSCRVSANTLALISREGATLTTKDGEELELLFVGKTRDTENKTEIRLRFPNGIFGGTQENLQIFTGKTYTQALVVPNNCLFQMQGDTKSWYVRVLDAQRNVVGNVAVKTGYTNGEYTCVTGLDEGILLDSGYARVLGGK